MTRTRSESMHLELRPASLAWPDTRPAVPQVLHGAGVRELTRYGLVYLLYNTMRWVCAGSPARARMNARWVVGLERSLHVDVEGSVQRAVGFGLTGHLLATVYLVAQLLVFPACLVWTYHRAPEVYRPLRNTIVGLWLICIPVFALFPVAPPRLAGVGLINTVTGAGGVSMTGHSTLFYNPFAAVPSLHVGIAFALGIAVAATLRRRWARCLALAWGPVVALAVIATGNHFVFDAVNGLAAVAVSYLGQRLARRRRGQGREAAPR